MTVDATAIARTLGIGVSYKDLRSGAAARLPQRIAVLGQGTTALAGYSTTKWELTTAAAAIARYGAGSPLGLIAKALRPAGGGGVGTIPVTLYPLADGTTAAAGDATPSGTASAAGTYRSRAGGVLSAAFSILAGAIDVSEVCKDLGQACQAVADFPLTIGWTYDTVTEDHAGNTGNGTLTSMSATTPCIPGDWILECTAEVANGGVFSLTDPDGTEVADDITITPGPGGTAVFSESGLGGTITDDTEDFDIGDTFTVTVPALTVTGTSKWKGQSASKIVWEMIDTLEDLTWTITQPTGGATNPTVDAALAQVGDVWETLVLNALDIEDETALDTIQTWGETRWLDTVNKPCLAFTGCCYTDEDDITAISETRTDDRINVQLDGVGSPNLPCVVAAKQLVQIATTANNDPAMDFVGPTSGLIAGDDGDQLDFEARDRVLKAGASTIEVHDGVIWVSDTVTMYAPDGDDLPAYRWVDTVVKIQNVVYNIALLFNSTDWRGHPLIADNLPTKNANARKPKQAVAALAALIDDLGASALLAETEIAKSTIVVEIDDDNPRRLNPSFTAAVSSCLGVVSVDFSFGFYFG